MSPLGVTTTTNLDEGAHDTTHTSSLSALFLLGPFLVSGGYVSSVTIYATPRTPCTVAYHAPYWRGRLQSWVLRRCSNRHPSPGLLFNIEKEQCVVARSRRWGRRERSQQIGKEEEDIFTQGTHIGITSGVGNPRDSKRSRVDEKSNLNSG